jgi:hypothetical protein
MEGFLSSLEKIGILLKVRQMLASDPRLEGLWKARSKMISNYPSKQQTLTDYPEYPTSSDPDVKAFCAAANAQLAIYRGKKGMFSREWIMDSARDMPVYQWWDQNGSSVPELQTFARMVLAQHASASICERINSEFEFVKARRRNRLGHEKANLLVGLFHNLRLLKRMKKPQYTEPTIAWNDDVEKTGVTTYAIGSPASACALLK